jgi:hypothetical protein
MGQVNILNRAIFCATKCQEPGGNQTVQSADENSIVILGSCKVGKDLTAASIWPAFAELN